MLIIAVDNAIFVQVFAFPINLEIKFRGVGSSNIRIFQLHFHYELFVIVRVSKFFAFSVTFVDRHFNNSWCSVGCILNVASQ